MTPVTVPRTTMPPSAETPMLETERLILRPPAPRDLDAYMTFIMSDRARYVGRETTRFAAWKSFVAEAGHWALNGFGPWAVTLKGDDASIGHIGAWHPEGFPERELGWLLWGGAEGQGIAYEAALAARAHDHRAHGSTALVSYIDPDNARSIRLAERLGAVLDPDAHGPFDGVLVYRHPAPEDL